MTLRYELIVFFSMALAALSSADPMILLTNAQAKCMSVEVPADSLLTIDYEAPDLVLPSDMEKGADPRTFRRFRTTITISQSSGRENHHGRNNANNRNKSRERVVQDLETKKGVIEYITQYDGEVSICVQSLAASSISPTPISLRVSESPAVVSTPPPEKNTELDSESQKNAKDHFSKMEQTLSGLISKTDMILRQADYAKELEVEFHEQSIAMNTASQWWPIVQLCVLLVTGFTQANHMVQFFRKHHIF